MEPIDQDQDSLVYCEACGELIDVDCFGEERCPDCDGPCPGCYDGGYEHDADEPGEEDLYTEDHVHFYYMRDPAFKVPTDASQEEMWAAIDRWCDENGYWPAVWFVSDHGNAHLMQRTSK